MTELFTFEFMQRALIAGVLVGFLSAYYGVFVVERGLSFLGSGLAHAAFGGIALGLFLAVDPLWIGLPFTVLVALGILWVQEKGQLAGDTAIGIFFALSMALGVIFLSLKQTASVDPFTYLFGSILAVTGVDIALAVAMLLLAVATMPSWGRWAYATYDRELARADNIPVSRDDHVLVIALALTIVIAAKIVGIVLIAAFLVIPPATARLIAPTFARMTQLAVILGVVTVPVGMVLSYWLDMPSGPVIILVQSAVFFVALMLRKRQ